MFLENAENDGTVDVVAIAELATELDLGDDELPWSGQSWSPVGSRSHEGKGDDDELELDLEPGSGGER